jgi:RNA polymerase sigma-70 factor (ECF subfamily)
MRKRDWKAVSLENLSTSVEFDLPTEVVIDSSTASEQAGSRTALLGRLKELIESELTPRQWTAITAELGGMPLHQIAEKLDTNTNSIYKLLHDARKKLRRGLEASGISIDDIREAWA